MKEDKTKLESANNETNNKMKEIEVLNLQNELSSLRAHLQQKESQLNTELEKSKKNITELQNELQEQRNKNDVSVLYYLVVNNSFCFLLMFLFYCTGRNYEKKIGKLWKL